MKGYVVSRCSIVYKFLAILVAASTFLAVSPQLAFAGSESAPLYESYYKVRRGDKLSVIARHHGISVHALARANGIANADHIYVGQRLYIPGGGYGRGYGEGYHDSYRNKHGNGYGGHTGGYGGPCNYPYRVARGDSLSKIAAYHGINFHALARANGIDNPSHIYVGQVICITPSGGYGYGQSHDYGSSHYPEYGGSRYTVKRGDTLTKIANWHGTSVYYLVNINKLRDRNHIYVGQRLRIR